MRMHRLLIHRQRSSDPADEIFVNIVGTKYHKTDSDPRSGDQRTDKQNRRTRSLKHSHISCLIKSSSECVCVHMKRQQAFKQELQSFSVSCLLYPRTMGQFAAFVTKELNARPEKKKTLKEEEPEKQRKKRHANTLASVLPAVRGVIGREIERVFLLLFPPAGKIAAANSCFSCHSLLCL